MIISFLDVNHALQLANIQDIGSIQTKVWDKTRNYFFSVTVVNFICMSNRQMKKKIRI